MAEDLGLAEGLAPVLTVVGSKGKGTTATYASACLAAAGLRVLTVTSPALRHNRERIRVDGRAVSETQLDRLGERLAAALPPAGEGYLSPSGLFLLAGVLHGREVGADVLVLEAGMGGRSDEVSLFPATVVAIGPVFGEHLGVLGDTPEEIAVEKAGVVAPTTRAVVSAPQSDGVAEAIASTVAPLPVEVVASVAGFRAAGELLGGTSARRLLQIIEVPQPAHADRVMGSVRLPGRLSWHRLADAEVLVDSAIDRTGVAVAVKAARERWAEGIDEVLLCLPDHKDLDGAIAELGGLAVTFVRLPGTHLRFTRPLPPSWRVVDIDEVALKGRVLAVGTGYFTGRILDLLGVDTDRLFTPWSSDRRSSP